MKERFFSFVFFLFSSVYVCGGKDFLQRFPRQFLFRGRENVFSLCNFFLFPLFWFEMAIGFKIC